MKGTYTYKTCIVFLMQLTAQDIVALQGSGLPPLPYGSGWLVTSIGTRYGRGRGYASECMKEVLFDADTEREILYLSVDPDPFDGSNLPYDALVAWYKRLGFFPFSRDDPSAMARLSGGVVPKQKEQDNAEVDLRRWLSR